MIIIIKAKNKNQLRNQKMDRFLIIFNDKKILIPSKIKEKQKNSEWRLDYGYYRESLCFRRY
jgi:hypothetical protein